MHLAVATYHGPRQCARDLIQDITQRVRAEEEIRRLNADLERRVAERTAEVQAKERFLRTIADVAPGVLGYWDADLRNRFANRRYIEWFGLTPETDRRPGLDRGVWPRTHRPAGASCTRCPEGRAAKFRASDDHVRRDRRLRLVRLAPDIVDGKVRGYVSAASDITEIKRAEAELIQRARDYEDLYNNAPCGYHSLDRTG